MKISWLCLFFLFTDVYTSDSVFDFSTYSNVRYEYSIEYPSDLLIPQPESENGDGSFFLDKQGLERLRVFGTLNEDTKGNIISLAKKFENELREFEKTGNNRVTYKFFENNYCVFSGYKGGLIYYEKVIQKKNAFAISIMQYSEEEKEVYNSLVKRIMKSFR